MSIEQEQVVDVIAGKAGPAVAEQILPRGGRGRRQASVEGCLFRGVDIQDVLSRPDAISYAQYERLLTGAPADKFVDLIQPRTYRKRRGGLRDSLA